MQILSAPLDICFSITNQCNLNCKHCFASTTRNSQDLTIDELLDIIEQIRELKIINVAISGGEPLMRKDFFNILKALSKLRINLSLNTNGILVTKDIARKLSRFPIKHYTVSLDGSCASIQDPFRGYGSFQKNIQGIKNLVEQKQHVLISTTVTRFNHHDIKNISLLAKDMGAYQIRFNTLIYTGNAICYNKNLTMTVKERFELLKKAEELKSRFGQFVTGSVFQVVAIMKEMKQKPKEKFPLLIQSCGAGVRKCTIRADGWVTPCEVLWDVKAGDLKEDTLYNIWHNSPVMKTFREPIEIKEEDIPECKGCQYLGICYECARCRPYYSFGRGPEYKKFYCWKEHL